MDKQTFTTKLHECCSDDELRPIMMCVHFMNGFAYASDGYVVIKQSLEYHSIINSELLSEKSLHRDNYKAIMGFEKAECNDMGVSCADSDGRTAFFEYFDRKGLEVPNFEAVIKPTGFKSIEFIGMRPDILNRLGKALHTVGGIIRMQFQGIDRCILVDAPGIENQIGVIMPAILNETLPFKSE
jgi:hypothetical protein